MTVVQETELTVKEMYYELSAELRGALNEGDMEACGVIGMELNQLVGPSAN